MERRSPDAILTVSELLGALSRNVRETFPEVLVEGEISNLRTPASGHIYLTLKDDGAQLRAVMWRSTASRLSFRPEDGQRVVVRGGMTVYEERGEMQMVITALRPVGEGALRQALEAMKRRLAAEGLFDPVRKRPLPALPRVIGIVTSGTGAAIHDMLSIVERRFPAVRIVVFPVKVQGDGASDEIAAALRALNALPASDERRPDVIIVGRGGGSLEDLWAFNEEPLVRAIHASGIPVVSAVGHESDVTLADLVADVRAATPSMAAELVVPTLESVLSAAGASVRDAERNLRRRLERLRHAVELAGRRLRFQSPRERILRLSQRNDDLLLRMDRAMDSTFRRTRVRAGSLEDRFRALDPLRPLHSGFALVTARGSVVRSATALTRGTGVVLRFADGTAQATVDGISPDVD